MKRRLDGIDRFVALALACIWLAGGAGGIMAGIRAGEPLVALASLFALAYGALWLRAFARARLSTWTALAKPWRRR